METICAEISYFLIFGYLLYLVSFMSIVTLDCDRMKLDAKVKKIAVKSFICMLLVIGAVFLSSEVRQFIHRPYYYIRNIYNLIDVVSLVMPMAYAINSLVGDGDGDDPFTPAYIGASVFFVYLDFVSFFFRYTFSIGT